MDIEHINQLVRERFPRLPSEWSCITEARMRDAARESYRQRLIDEFRRAEEILVSGGPTDAEA